MLKRLGLILGVSVAILVGCQDESDWTKVEGVEVVEINSVETCVRGCWTDTTITFKKDDIVFKLEDWVDVDLLYVGQVLDVYYDEDYYLKKYEIPFENNK